MALMSRLGTASTARPSTAACSMSIGSSVYSTPRCWLTSLARRDALAPNFATLMPSRRSSSITAWRVARSANSFCLLVSISVLLSKFHHYKALLFLIQRVIEDQRAKSAVVYFQVHRDPIQRVFHRRQKVVEVALAFVGRHEGDAGWDAVAKIDRVVS